MDESQVKTSQRLHHRILGPNNSIYRGEITPVKPMHKVVYVALLEIYPF